MTLCTGCVSHLDHSRGFHTPGVVHLIRVRATKAALRRLWILAYKADARPRSKLPRWEGLYQRELWITTNAIAMGIRLPRQLSREDRARTRELLALVPSGFRTKTWIDVHRWARR